MKTTMLFPSVLEFDQKGGQILNPEAMLNTSDTFSSIIMPSGQTSPEILLDFGRKVTGYLHIEFTRSSIDHFRIDYGPVKKSIHAHVEYAMPIDNHFESPHYIACRYMRIRLITHGQQPENVFAEIRTLYLIPSEYPCSWQGSFSCEDCELDYIWKTGARTVELCMQKNTETSAQKLSYLPQYMIDFIRDYRGRYSDYVIFDGPRRDREAWLGDIRTEALAAMSAFGSYDVVKSSMDIFYHLQKENGITDGCAGTHQPFLEYNLWWLIAIWECYLYSGDHDFLIYIYPGVKKLSAHLFDIMDERGFVSADGNWMWTLPREGYSSGINTILVHALRCTANIAEEMFDTEDASLLRTKAEEIVENLNTVFWNDEKGVYMEDFKYMESNEPVPLDVNCYAILFGVADEQKTKRILTYIRQNMWCPFGSTTLDKRIEHLQIYPGLQHYPMYEGIRNAQDPEKAALSLMYPHNKQIWPFVNGYEVEARFVSGDVDGALELIHLCWGNPAYKETGSFWEMFDIDAQEFAPRSIALGSKDDCVNSAAHGWSGWVSHLMQSYLLGIRPITPGFSKTLIRPMSGSLQHIEGTMPTPKGIIGVKIDKTADTYTLHISKPAGVDIDPDITAEEAGGRTTSVIYEDLF